MQPRKCMPVMMFSLSLCNLPARRGVPFECSSAGTWFAYVFRRNLRMQSVQGGSRRAPLVVKIHRRPLYFERWNAAPMQHDAMTAADLEHCRRWLLEGASYCSSCGALIIVLLATDAHHLPMISSPAPQRIPLVRALANTRPAMTACMAGDEPSRTARAYPTHACAWRSVRLYEPRASFPTRAALGFVRRR